MTRVPTGETLFRLAYGSKVVILAEVGDSQATKWETIMRVGMMKLYAYNLIWWTRSE